MSLSHSVSHRSKFGIRSRIIQAPANCYHVYLFFYQRERLGSQALDQRELMQWNCDQVAAVWCRFRFASTFPCDVTAAASGFFGAHVTRLLSRVGAEWHH